VDPDVVSNIRLNDNDVLPAANFIFSPREDMKVRLVGTQTLARPEFRELAPFEFTDFVGGQTVIGNPALTSTKIWNADARWEWFPSSQEVIAASVFYKYFDDPIERVAQPRAGGLVSFRNAASAQNVGVELELRKNLEFMGPAVRNFSLGANFAYIYSRVKLGGQCSILTDPTCDPTTSDVSTSRERPLQGQSPFVLNLYLDYSNKKSGTEGRLLYNSLGRRIDRAMGLGAPDIYEEARHFFDLIISQKVYKELEVSIAVTNILNWPIRFTQGPDKSVVETTWPGTSFRLGVGWKY
jgi:outer membrane receptor protein involved in Fe transport